MTTSFVPILYGTESGNSEYCAGQLAKTLCKLDIDARAVDMGAFDPGQLRQLSFAVFVTSTYGNGAPPYNAVDLLEYLQSGEASLPELRFAVCGLGDTSFEYFCKCGKDFDEALERCGATRLVERADCDVDFDEVFDEFESAVVSALEHEASSLAVETSPPPFALPSAPNEAASRVFSGRLLVKRKLSGTGSNKWTMHYEFDVSNCDTRYEVGDCFAVHPRNGPRQIDSLVSAMGADGASLVRWQGESVSLSSALEGACLSHVGSDLLDLLADLPSDTSRPLRDVLAAGTEATRQYRRGHDVFEVVRDIAPKGVPAQPFVSCLRKLAPRLYSVASSPAKDPNRVSLTVETVRYQRAGRVVEGVASSFMATRLSEGDAVRMHHVSNPAFRFEDDANPVIMIGPGTGIAPFRAYLEHLEHLGRSSKRTWLFFGHQREAVDFLYRDDLRRWAETGVLNRLELAWSRAQAHKIYVQHRLIQHGADVWRWLEQGACVYVCGDATSMEPDVAEALRVVASAHGAINDPNAWLEDLRRAGRYKTDVY